MGGVLVLLGGRSSCIDCFVVCRLDYFALLRARLGSVHGAIVRRLQGQFLRPKDCFALQTVVPFRTHPVDLNARLTFLEKLNAPSPKRSLPTNVFSDQLIPAAPPEWQTSSDEVADLALREKAVHALSLEVNADRSALDAEKEALSLRNAELDARLAQLEQMMAMHSGSIVSPLGGAEALRMVHSDGS